MKKLLVCAMIMLFVSGCNNQKDSSENLKNQSQNQETTETTEFKLSNLTGDNIEISIANGGIKLTNNIANMIIFATPDCAPCKTELSYIFTLAQKYKGDAQIMLATLNANTDEIKELSDEFNLSNEALTNTKELAKALNINALPAIIISDKNGNKIRSYVGLVPVEMLISDINLAVLR